MAVKTASDMGIFNFFSKRASFATCEDLAEEKGADSQLVGKYNISSRKQASRADNVRTERLMRVLVCNGFAKELGVGQYEPTQLSRQMTERKTIGTMDSL